MPSINELKKILKSGAATHGLLLVGGDTETIKKSIIEFLKELESSASVSTRTTEPLRRASERKPSTASLGAVQNTNLTFDRETNNAPLIDAEFFEKLSDESLGINAARRLKEFLSQKPIKSLHKTAVIVGGDALTHQAQNALLKICEDPPQNSQIILMVKNEENLLPTLRSRFQKIHLTEDNSSQKAASQIPEEVMRLAERFLKSDARVRSEIIKLVTGKSNETGEDKTLIFLDALILKLAKDPVRHASFLGAVLKQKMLIASLSLNRRLQLAFLSSLWYNNQYKGENF